MHEHGVSVARRRLAAAALVALVVPSCGGGKSPATSTPVTTQPAVTPTPSAVNGGSTCSLGKGDPYAQCVAASGTGKLQRYIEAALDMLVREQPQLLDMTVEERPNAGTYRVKDVEGYLNAVVNNIRRQGACSERDADTLNFQRVLVKDTNDYSEGYILISDKGFIQRNPYALVQYCEGPSFPLDRVGDVPPAGSGCGKPYPPPISQWASKIHIFGPDYFTLDSTPLVGPDANYCMSVGYTDNRSFCPVRAEHGPEREACEAWRVGKAADTGRYGPTWTFQGKYCTGQASGCENHVDNQYGLYVWENGIYTMCDVHGVCGEQEVAR